MLKKLSSNFYKSSVRLFASATRGKYEILTNGDVDHFKSILKEPSMVLTDDEDLQSYNTDWLRIYEGQSKLVLRPKTTEQVSKILEYCNKRNLAIVPQGGNTGLVGGSVPVFDEVILSTQLMNQVLSFEPTSGVLTCQAGCVLESLNDYLNPSQFMIPWDLGAKGSCQIGGNVSTNAGGLRLLRYGSLHSSVLGVEAVLANGSVVDFLSTMRKDNSGYHLRHLFIGSEGTLGVVTKVSVLCAKLSNSVNLAMCSCESFEHVKKMLSIAKEQLGEILSAFEVMDDPSMQCVEDYLGTKVPIGRSGFYVIVETSGSLSEHDQDKLTRFIDSLDGIIADGTLALDSSKIKNLWKFRETAYNGLVKQGFIYNYDVSLPLSHYYDVVDIMKKKLGKNVKSVCGLGHVGDGNLHLIVIDDKYDENKKKKIDSVLFDYVLKQKGSISAEHGVGLDKRDHLHLSRSEESINLMRNMKGVLDPNHILNPYKVLPLTH